jgi:Ca2+/Na+ antiporter
VLWDGWFSRLDAVVLISLFILWLFVVIRHARRHAARNLEEIVEAGLVSPRKTLLMVLGGLALLVAAAQLVVEGGKGVALALGWPLSLSVPSS